MSTLAAPTSSPKSSRSGVAFAREQSHPETIWRTLPSPHDEPSGGFGHPARNRVLDYLQTLQTRPAWCWSLDDDDVATFGALDMIRGAIEANQAADWYVFRMRGGSDSHFAGTTIPAVGNQIKIGHVGTPMLVFPTSCTARFGTGHVDSFPPDMPDGYFGDWEMARDLRAELGNPEWVAQTVCEVRPGKVEA